MNDQTKMRDLAEKLVKLTETKKIKWQEDPNGEDIPWVKAGERFIVLREGRNPSGSTIYRMSIEDASDNPVDIISDEDLDDEDTRDYYYNLLGKLFAMARRQSSGADMALDDVLSALDKLDK